MYVPADSARINKYLDGGVVPTTTQTIQFLMRNDIIQNVQEAREEVKFQVSEREMGERGSAEDILVYLGAAKKSFDDYLALAEPQELKQVR
ncbi:unnamed protein product [Chrysoparadoxa australica]